MKTSKGQAYTEYTIILVFGILVVGGISTLDGIIGTGGVLEFFFNYYASLANYLNLAFF